MSRALVVSSAVSLPVLGLAVAVFGLRRIVAGDALGYVLALGGFATLLLTPTLVSRLSRGSRS